MKNKIQYVLKMQVWQVMAYLVGYIKRSNFNLKFLQQEEPYAQLAD